MMTDFFYFGEINPLKLTRQSQKAFKNVDKHLNNFLWSTGYYYLFKFMSNIYSYNLEPASGSPQFITFGIVYW